MHTITEINCAVLSYLRTTNALYHRSVTVYLRTNQTQVKKLCSIYLEQPKFTREISQCPFKTTQIYQRSCTLMTNFARNQIILACISKRFWIHSRSRLIWNQHIFTRDQPLCVSANSNSPQTRQSLSHKTQIHLTEGNAYPTKPIRECLSEKTQIHQRSSQKKKIRQESDNAFYGTNLIYQESFDADEAKS